MKIKLTYIISGLFIILIASSCEKWLDVTASSEIKAEDQFKTEAGFKDALMGVYIGMTNPALYSRNMTWGIVDLLSQQYAPLSQGAIYFNIQQYQYESLKANSQIETMWNNMYKVIANINNGLAFMDKNKEVLDPVNYAIIKGELLGLRAFLHFDLMRLFGRANVANRTDLAAKAAIPYVINYTKDQTPQLSYSETFEVMLEDIDAALDLLKNDPVYNDLERDSNYYDVINKDDFYQNRENRMNYYAVMALKARVLMYQGGQDNVDTAGLIAEDIISKSTAGLIDSQSYPIASDLILYPEHIFNLNITAFENIVNPYLSADDAARKESFYLDHTTAGEIYETANPNIGVVDIRFNTLLEDQLLGKVCIKLKQTGPGSPGILSSHLDIMPLITLSEMYYIAAESYMNGSAPNLNKAIEYLNIVRSSRGIVEEIPNDADLATLNDELFKEYRKEFISEGQLFFYYKRIGLEHIPGLSAETIADDQIYMLPYPDGEIQFGRTQ